MNIAGAKLAETLRHLATEVENSGIEFYTRVDLGHFADVRDANGVVNDAKFLGWTTVISTMPSARGLEGSIRELLERGVMPAREFVYPVQDAETLERVRELVADWGTRQLQIAADQCPGILRGTGVQAAAPTLCGNPIEAVPAGSLCVIRYPVGQPGLKDKLEQSLAGIYQQRDDLAFLMMPEPFELERADVAQVKQLRDRLNEIIYDKERSG